MTGAISTINQAQTMRGTASLETPNIAHSHLFTLAGGVYGQAAATGANCVKEYAHSAPKPLSQSLIGVKFLGRAA